MINPIQKILNIKFRNKLILMCIIAIVPVTLVGIFLLYSIIDVLRTNSSNEVIFQADSLKVRLRDTVTTVSNISERLMESEDLNALIKNDFVNKDEYYNFYMKGQIIPEYLEAYPQIEDIGFYIDIDGFVYNTYFRYAEDYIKAEGWYSDAEASSKSKWHLIKSDEEYRLALVRPLTDKNENFCGVMVMTVNPKWYDEMASEVNYGVVFSVSQGSVFYSSIDGCREGTLLKPNVGMSLGKSDSEILTKGDTLLERKGYTAVSYFDYENSGNLFQVYVVKPYAIFDNSVQDTIVAYIWYISMCIILSVLITILFSSMYSRRIQLLQSKMHNVADGDFDLSEEIKGNDEIYDLYEDLKKMVDSMQKLMNDAYESKILSESFKLNQVEAEFKALASQINPHFLYNTLETIRMKAYCNDDKETADLVKKLGKFMRRCLEVKDSMVTLKSELEFTRSYLELQAARFGDRVSYSIYCEVDGNYMILPLIIQPVVENAFVHGIESAKSNGKINVKIMYRGDKVEIEVSDNGQGIPDDKLAELLEKLKENDTSSGKSIGLTNVNKRIKMYHGEKYGLSVKTEEGVGTDICITLPREVDGDVMKRLPESSKNRKEGLQ